MIQIILVVLGFMVVISGFYEVNHFTNDQNQSQDIAQETANAWNTFAQSLSTYVQDNEKTITGSETVSCSTLQSSGYYTGSCTDPVGETMEGVIAAPYGFPQSWGVIAESPPSSNILGKFGISNPYKWHSFTYNVATLLQGDDLTAAVYNSNTQTFKEPFGTQSSNYNNYSFTSNPSTYGLSSNSVGPDGLMAFPQLHKEPGYWLWQAQLLSETNTASISFVNYGYSAVCPTNGSVPSIQPVSWNSPWLNYNNNGPATYFSWEFQGNWSDGMFVSDVDPSNAFNYHQVFVCIPSPESLVNSSTSYNPFTTADNNAPQNVVNPNYNGYWNGDGQSWNGQDYAQAGELYTISVGSQTYSLVTYAGATGGDYPGGGYTGRISAMAFYIGSYSGMNRVSPSIYGGPNFNNNGGFYSPPVVTVNSQSVVLN